MRPSQLTYWVNAHASRDSAETILGSIADRPGCPAATGRLVRSEKVATTRGGARRDRRARERATRDARNIDRAAEPLVGRAASQESRPIPWRRRVRRVPELPRARAARGTARAARVPAVPRGVRRRLGREVLHRIVATLRSRFPAPPAPGAAESARQSRPLPPGRACGSPARTRNPPCRGADPPGARRGPAPYRGG